MAKLKMDRVPLGVIQLVIAGMVDTFQASLQPEKNRVKLEGNIFNAVMELDNNKSNYLHFAPDTNWATFFANAKPVRLTDEQAMTIRALAPESYRLADIFDKQGGIDLRTKPQA